MNQAKKPKYSTRYFEESVQQRGWFLTHRFLLLRRFCQILIILLFTIPFTTTTIEGTASTYSDGEAALALELAHEQSALAIMPVLQKADNVGRNNEDWILKGTLANSELLSVIPFGDPFVFVQSLAARNFYTFSGILGVLIITLSYWILGGRTYCSFVCPINIVTDLAAWIRRQLRINNQLSISRKARFYIMGIAIVVSALFQVIAWELINPITGIFRALVYGGFSLTNFAVTFVLTIFILDIIGAANLWCGHLCPVGAFYSLLGKKTMLRISAPKIGDCDDCMDCYKACPEPHVLRPLIRNKALFVEADVMPSVGFSDCTRCGRCIDVCPEEVFRYDILSKSFQVKENNPKVKASEL